MLYDDFELISLRHGDFKLISFRQHLTDDPDSPLIPLPAWMPQDWETGTYPRYDPYTDDAVSFFEWLTTPNKFNELGTRWRTILEVSSLNGPGEEEFDSGPYVRDAYRMVEILAEKKGWRAIESCISIHAMQRLY